MDVRVPGRPSDGSAGGMASQQAAGSPSPASEVCCGSGSEPSTELRASSGARREVAASVSPAGAPPEGAPALSACPCGREQQLRVQAPSTSACSHGSSRGRTVVIPTFRRRNRGSEMARNPSEEAQLLLCAAGAQTRAARGPGSSRQPHAAPRPRSGVGRDGPSPGSGRLPSGPLRPPSHCPVCLGPLPTRR